jgi:hypothetical protein
MRRLALHSFVYVVLAGACASNKDDAFALPSPGDACDLSRPLTCGSLASGGSRRDVIIFCKDGRYETVLNCPPSGSGLKNRCHPGGNNTVTDCVDEPMIGQVTRCRASGSGTSVVNTCTVGNFSGP